MTERVAIMGAAGRDFHDFNVRFRGAPPAERVVAFTRAPGQNLGEAESGDPGGTENGDPGGTGNGDPGETENGETADRPCYPPGLAGPGYGEGIPVVPESELEAVVTGAHPAVPDAGADRVVFSYSDVSHEAVMHAASRALAAGADFELLGPETMQVALDTPVLAVDAVRTGCGKSSIARGLADALDARGADVAVVREPMPYGDLLDERAERFATPADLDAADLTLEEREEYAWHVEAGHPVHAGVDYEAVLANAAAEADVIVWDGGNNELPFAVPDVHLVLTDPTRPGHELRYHPGEANLRAADAVCLTKLAAAEPEGIATVEENVRETVPEEAPVLRAESVVSVPDPGRIEGARVLVIEDGPTVTHGDAAHGAATVAARRYGAAECVDPEPAAVGSVAETLAEYDHLDRVLPAMGYTDAQVAELEATVGGCDADLVLAGTPCDVSRVLDVDAPVVDVDYRFDPVGWSFEKFVADRAGALGLTE
ncbi:GTPase [Haloparvum sedimenti]|uniref:GTPase n=1 Tax=Haloparvum sedimenti TaxID=1678448 RepID=UPI000A714403|nr:GTPase [Haloparvum sedimenti]